MTHAPLSQAIAVLLLFCGAATAEATTRTVTSLNDSGAGTLRDTLAASQNGDTINFSVTGAIQLTSGTLAVHKSVTITGPGPAVLQVLRASGSYRVFEVGAADNSFNGPTVVISGITIAFGFSVDDGSGGVGYGGGINAYGSALTISNCVVTSNHGDYFGGGISANRGTLTVVNSTFSSNGTTHTTNSPLVSQKWGGGGAIYASNARVSLENSTFVNNSTAATSAGFNGGGAIFNDGGSVVMTNCTFSNNSTTAGLSASGGAIYNTTVFGGRADVTSHNCTFSENASSSGGGIANEGASSGNSFVTLDNTILFSSSNTPGANLFNTGDGTAITSNGYNLSSDDGGGFLTATADQKNTNPNLGPLQDNGGPTKTMALQPGSPAQDKGRRLGSGTDQRGLPRPLDIGSIANAQGGDGSDIGAVEMDGVQTAPNFIVSTIDDHDDGTCGYVDCTLREAIKAANAAGGVNTISFKVAGTITLQAALGTLTVTNSVNIYGPGVDQLAVSGNHAVRVFSFTAGQNWLFGLAIRDGEVAAANGSGNGAEGAGIFNGVSSNLRLSYCLLFGNSLLAGSNDNPKGTGGSGSGGGIANAGTVLIEGCTFNNNSALAGRGSNATGFVGNVDGGAGGAAQGGAIFNDAGATLTMSDSTLGNNSAIAGNGGSGRFGGDGGLAAGGVFNLGTMTITAVTLSLNTGTGGLGGNGNNLFNNGFNGVSIGGLAARGSGNTVSDTISAGNTGHDADGAFTSQGFNLIGIGDFSTGFTAQGDKVGTTANKIDPKLGPLQYNGGFTDTFALTAGSPAIDAGSTSLPYDQRGAPRIIDDPQVPNAAGSDGSDIGAYEAGALPPVPPTVTTNAASNVTTTSATLNVTINPQGYDATFYFTSDFAIFPTQQAGSGIADVPLSVNVAGLAPNTTYHFNVTASNVAGTTVGAEQTFTTASIPPATFANVATRLKVETGDNVLFGGFIITGTQPKKVIVRALGPSVQAPGPLADPVLELYQGNTLLETNDNWVDSPNKQAIIDSTIPPPNNLESAIVRSLPANATAYTAIVRGVNNGTGIGVIEVYDLDGSVDSKLANISTRGLVQTGDNVLIAGTIIVGQAAQNVLICALGPSLPVQGNLADPTLELHDGNGALMEANDNWIDSANKQAIIDTGAAPTNNLESAIIRTLPANGAQYTAVVRGANNSTGIAVVEVFALP